MSFWKVQGALPLVVCFLFIMIGHGSSNMRIYFHVLKSLVYTISGFHIILGHPSPPPLFITGLGTLCCVFFWDRIKFSSGGHSLQQLQSYLRCYKINVFQLATSQSLIGQTRFASHISEIEIGNFPIGTFRLLHDGHSSFVFFFSQRNAVESFPRGGFKWR